VTRAYHFGIVEDDEMCFRLLERLLFNHFPGSRVTWFDRGEKLLESCDELTFDALILDNDLGMTSGPEVIQALTIRGVRIPMIGISGSSKSEFLFRRAGTPYFMEKAVVFNDLPGLLRSLLPNN
jgi:DNA-binding NtrC family response regulator